MVLPNRFVERTKEILKDEYSSFELALQEHAPVSVRVNDKHEYLPSDERVPWCDDGFYLKERPLFTADPLFHSGVYYVQEASSMFLAKIVQQFFPNVETVLDLCAAPGGKSTLLLQNLSDKSLLVSNEIVRSRAFILAENISKWGNPNCLVTNNEPGDFSRLKNLFDAIVVDAPCSGEGMFRKDPGAIEEWTEQNVQNCAIRQKNILSDVWDALKPGGILVYSTCTYNKEENEENVEWCCHQLGAEVLQVNLPEETGIVNSGFGYRFYPHHLKGEGFFISVIKKNDSEFKNRVFKSENKKGTNFVMLNSFPFKLDKSKKWKLINDQNYIRAYEEDKLDKFMYLIKNLKCLESGILMAEIKGKDIIPATQLALSKVFDNNSVVSYEVDYDTAIKFLKKETIYLEIADRGFVLITYKNQPLGWVKNLGNRCNNLYPNNWRIRMNL